MGTHKIRLNMSVIAVLDIDDNVINVVDEEWKKTFYDFEDTTEIILHIATNLLAGNSLSGMDGWADQPDTNAYLNILDVEVDEPEEISEGEYKILLDIY